MTLPTALDAITLDGASRTNDGTVTFTVAFTRPVQGLNASNFSLSGTGTLAGTSVEAVLETTAGDASTYTVTVSTGTGDGDLKLAFDPAGVLDLDGNPIQGSTGTLEFNDTSVIGNGNYDTYKVFVADLNGDGHLDVVTGSFEGTAAVILNNGDGTFAEAVTYNGTAAGIYSGSGVALGDLNGDGKADLVITDNNNYSGDGNSTSVLLNNGDGTFAGPVSYSTGGFSQGVAIGDVTGDGKVDIVTTSTNGDSFSVLAGNGDGTFSPATDVGTGTGFYANDIQLADLNGDGKLDIAAANNSNLVRVVFGNGDGTFAAPVDYTVNGWDYRLAAGDLNGDGSADIVTAGQSYGITVLLSDGQGGFARQDYASVGYVLDVAMADMNGDGHLDVVLPDYGSNFVRILLNNGDGSFAAPLQFESGTSSWSVAVGDLSGDGAPDIVATSLYAAGAVMLTQQAGGNATVTLDRTDATGTASLQGAPAANATSLTFDLTFSEEVTGLDTADFALVQTGTAAGTITGFSGSGNSYSLTVSDITGTGSLAIELASGATVSDLAGNAVILEPVAPHALDTQPPAAPTLRTPHALTTETRPIFAGLAEAGSTVKLYDTDGTTLIGSVVADANGNWVLRRTAVSLTDGQHIVTATATDAAGNVSAATSPVSVTVDTIAPGAPLITSAALTNTASPVLAGTAEALSTVKVYDGATLLGTVATNASGVWTLPLTTALTEGAHSISAVAQDAVGHNSPASLAQSLVVDLTAPAIPVLDTLPALGNAAIATLAGTAEAHAMVEVFDGTTSLGSTAADGSGHWSLPLGTALADGSYSLTATATDAAGNISAASAAMHVELDTQKPAAPSLDVPPLANDSTPILTGTAEAGSTVEVFDGTVSLGKAMADANGAWSLDPTTGLADGAHSLTAVATDKAGNASDASAAAALTVDTAAPGMPTLDMVPQADLDNTPVFFGTAEANSTVEVFDGTVSLGKATADADGDWWFITPAALANGEHGVTAVAIDAAGNASAASDALAVTINVASPEGPTIPDDDAPPQEPAATQAVYRFYDLSTGGHLYTTDEAERDMAMSAPTIMRYEGVGFSVPLDPSVPGVALVHRFYEPNSGDHHYTISGDEAFALLTTPGWQDEGNVFLASTTGGEGLEAVYRFFDTGSRTHFFTADTAERDGILAHAPGWTYEGIAFYVPVQDAAAIA